MAGTTVSKRNLSNPKINFKFILNIGLGFFIGYALSLLFWSEFSRSLCTRRLRLFQGWNQSDLSTSETLTTSIKQDIYVGIISAESRLLAKAESAVQSWASHPKLKVEIFSGNSGIINENRNYKESFLSSGTKVIQPDGISDAEYSSQDMTLAMIKFIQAFHCDRYDWYILTKDDIYIDVENTKALLNRINKYKPLYLGSRVRDASAGHVSQHMSGVGIILSKEVLCSLAPNLKNFTLDVIYENKKQKWRKNSLSSLIPKQSLSWEVLEYFFLNDPTPLSSRKLKKVKENPTKLVIFKETEEGKSQIVLLEEGLRRKIRTILNKVFRLEKYLPDKDVEFYNRPNLDWSVQDHRRWDSIIPRSIFKVKEGWLIRRPWHSTLHSNIDQNLKLYKEEMKSKDYENSLRLQTLTLWSSYYSVRSPSYVDLIARIKCLYMKTISPVTAKNIKANAKGVNKIKVVHLRQTFLKHLPFFYEPKAIDISNVKAQQEIKGPISAIDRIIVNFLTTLSGRSTNFVRFLNNFETTFLKFKTNVNLIVAFFPKGDPSSNEIGNDIKFVQKRMELLSSRYPNAHIKLILQKPGTEFSRGVGLQVASEHVLGKNEIIFFCDIDLVFRPSILTHVRRNVIQGKRVFYPTFFSQYDPELVYQKSERPVTEFRFEEQDGFWRVFSFGMFAIYKTDFDATSGFNTSIHGWGLEDVNMIDSIFERTSLDIFSSSEPAQVHVFHDKHCDQNTTEEQYTSCLNSRLSHFGSKTFLYGLYKISKQATKKKLSL